MYLPILLAFYAHAPAPPPRPVLTLTIELGQDWPNDSYSLNVVVKNVSRKDVQLKYGIDPRASLDFVVKKGQTKVSRPEAYGNVFSPHSIDGELLVIPAGKTHTFSVSIQRTIEENHQGPGRFQVLASFRKDDFDIQSAPYTLIVATAEP